MKNQTDNQTAPACNATANFMDVIQNFREAFETTRESAHAQTNGGVLITHEAFTALDFAYAQSDEPYTLTL